MDKAEYQNEEYKADIDLIGMMTKPKEQEEELMAKYAKEKEQ